MNIKTICIALTTTTVAALAGNASASIITAGSISDYIYISLNEKEGETDIHSSNFEIGANKAPVPSNTDFLDNDGGPTLEGAVPALPSGIKPVFQGVSGKGNIAVLDPKGQIDLQNVGVYADPNIGIQLAGRGNTQSRREDINKSSNSFFNDPNQFPNTFNPNTQTGLNVEDGDAVQSTRIDADGTPGSAGVTYDVDFTSLQNEIDNAQLTIDSLQTTGVLDLGGNKQGEIKEETFIFNLASGLNVIDINTGGSGNTDNDFKLNNANFVVQGDASSSVIFRLRDGQNMLISNANVLLGDGGIEEGNVLFYSSFASETDNVFDFDNTILSGVAFWSLGNEGEININNGQGCVQLVADNINLNDTRFAHCTSDGEGILTTVPAPGAAGLLAVAGVAAARRRRG